MQQNVRMKKSSLRTSFRSSVVVSDSDEPAALEAVMARAGRRTDGRITSEVASDAASAVVCARFACSGGAEGLRKETH